MGKKEVINLDAIRNSEATQKACQTGRELK